MDNFRPDSGASSRLRLVRYDESYLSCSGVWLRDPEIKLLTDTPAFTDCDQRAFFRSLPNRADYYVWGVEVDGFQAGAAGLKNVRDRKAEYWGYIGEKALWGQGLGQHLLSQVELKARNIGISTLTLRVIKGNIRAIRLYSRAGYNQKDSNNRTIEMVKYLHDD